VAVNCLESGDYCQIRNVLIVLTKVSLYITQIFNVLLVCCGHVYILQPAWSMKYWKTLSDAGHTCLLNICFLISLMESREPWCSLKYVILIQMQILGKVKYLAEPV